MLTVQQVSIVRWACTPALVWYAHGWNHLTTPHRRHKTHLASGVARPGSVGAAVGPPERADGAGSVAGQAVDHPRGRSVIQTRRCRRRLRQHTLTSGRGKCKLWLIPASVSLLLSRCMVCPTA